MKEDLRAIRRSYKELILIGNPNTEDLLIKALNEYGYKNMAEDYLNCGNPKLEEAARKWAYKHGYKVVPLFGRSYSGPVWGHGSR